MVLYPSFDRVLLLCLMIKIEYKTSNRRIQSLQFFSLWCMYSYVSFMMPLLMKSFRELILCFGVWYLAIPLWITSLKCHWNIWTCTDMNIKTWKVWILWKISLIHLLKKCITHIWEKSSRLISYHINKQAYTKSSNSSLNKNIDHFFSIA